MRLYELTERLENLEGLDPIAKKLGALAGKVLPHGPVKDLASGTWLGHALHPTLTDLPIGLWMSASLLDVLGREEDGDASERLIGLGILASVPTAATGWSDYSDTMGGERRVGLVHAAANGAALALYGGSLAARRRGRKGLGVALGLAGAGVVAAGGYLGGHLSLSLGLGVDRTAFEQGPSEWRDVAGLDELGEDEPRRVAVDGVDIFVVKRSGRVFALANRCTHLGGPLNEGSLDGDCIICPWHGSTFRLSDGAVARGPARAPQPLYDVRVDAGRVLVLSSKGGH